MAKALIILEDLGAFLSLWMSLWMSPCPQQGLCPGGEWMQMGEKAENQVLAESISSSLSQGLEEES